MAINLGNIVSVNGKSVGSGISSGLDTAALIEGLTAAKRIPAVQLEDTIELNATKTSTYAEFRTLVESFQTASDFLRNPPGTNNDDANIFEYRTSALTTNSASAASTFTSVTADPGTNIGDYDISIGQLATATQDRTGSFASKTADITGAASGAITSLDFGANAPAVSDTITIGGAVFTFVANGTASSGSNVELGTTLAETLTNIKTHLNSASAEAVHTDVNNFDYTVSGTQIIATSKTIGGADDAINFSASIVAGAPTVGDTAGFLSNVAGAFSAGTFFYGATEVVNQTSTTDTTVSLVTADYSVNGSSAASVLTAGGIENITAIASDGAKSLEGTITGISGTFNNDPTSTLALSVTINSTVYTSNALSTADSAIAAVTSIDYTTTAPALGETITIGGGVFTFGANGVPSSGATIELGIDLPSTLINIRNHLNSVDAATVHADVDNFTYSISGNLIVATSDSVNSTDNAINFSTNVAGAVIGDTVGTYGGIAASQVITFTDAAGDTSFTLTNGAAVYDIDNDTTKVNSFIAAIEADISGQTILQSRAITNVVSSSNIPPGSPLSGLESANVILTTSDFGTTTGEAGDIEGFTVTHNGAGDNDISVIINDVTYSLAGHADLFNDNITLTATGGKTLKINLADAVASFTASDAATATELQNSLDYAFGTKNLTSYTLNAGDSLIDIESAINAQSTVSGVSASIIQVSGTDFRLSVQATDVGLDNSYSLLDYNKVWHAGTGDGTDGVAINSISTAQDSFSSVNGLVVQRSSNSISDVIAGLKYDLIKVTDTFVSQVAYDAIGTPTEVTATVTNDTSTTEAAVINFINAYNELRVFSEAQTLRDDDGKFAEGADLRDDSTLATLISQVSTQITKSISGASSVDFASLGSIGITLYDFAGDGETPATTNLLTYDPNDLSNALANNFNNVREIFEYSFTANSSDLTVFKKTNNTTLTDYKVDIDTSKTAGKEVEILDSSGTFLYYATLATIGTGTYSITGVAGTTLEGMQFVYTGDGTDVITVGSSYGIADSLFSVFKNYTEDDGLLDVAVQNIADETERLEDEVTDIDAVIEQYRDQLLLKYTALEAAITKINTLLQFIEAQSDAANNN